MHTLKNQQRPPQIPPTLLRNPLIQPLIQLPTLLLPTLLQHITNLPLRRRRHPNKQRPAPNRRNNIRRTIRQQNQPQIRTIFLHCSPQRRLRISRKMISLINHHDLKSLLGTCIDLLSLRDFFEEVLNDYAIVVPDI
jgi:hypothetical protein